MKELQALKETALHNNWNIYNFSVMTAEGIEDIRIVSGNACNDSYSVAKLFTLTAVGMLYDQGLLSLEEPILPLFASQMPSNFDSKWKKVTVEDVILHSFGTAEGYLDIDVEDILQYGTDDFLKVVFSHPLKYQPGQHWQYSDAAYYLLSRVVTKKTNERLDDYLMKRLFAPLCFQEMAWSKCPKGYTMGATGLYLRSHDMVKLGWVYLNGGEYQGKRILSREFVTRAIQKGYELSPIIKDGIYGKGGMSGQMLMFSLADRMAVAWHAFDTTDFSADVRAWVVDNLFLGA